MAKSKLPLYLAASFITQHYWQSTNPYFFLLFYCYSCHWLSVDLFDEIFLLLCHNVLTNKFFRLPLVYHFPKMVSCTMFQTVFFNFLHIYIIVLTKMFNLSQVCNSFTSFFLSYKWFHTDWCAYEEAYTQAWILLLLHKKNHIFGVSNLTINGLQGRYINQQNKWLVVSILDVVSLSLAT